MVSLKKKHTKKKSTNASTSAHANAGADANANTNANTNIIIAQRLPIVLASKSPIVGSGS